MIVLGKGRELCGGRHTLVVIPRSPAEVSKRADRRFIIYRRLKRQAIVPDSLVVLRRKRGSAAVGLELKSHQHPAAAAAAE